VFSRSREVAAKYLRVKRSDETAAVCFPPPDPSDVVQAGFFVETPTFQPDAKSSKSTQPLPKLILLR
jgi:hypothetical protein